LLLGRRRAPSSATSGQDIPSDEGDGDDGRRDSHNGDCGGSKNHPPDHIPAVFAKTLLGESGETASETKLTGRGYLPKRPRPKKPRTANTRMTMMMIQRIDTMILSLGAFVSLWRADPI
jgi:hypothetical protein